MGLSRRTALFALSLTLPLDHFFFLAGKRQFGVGMGWGPVLPWVEGPAAFAMVGDGCDGKSGFVVEKRAVPK